MTFKEFKYVAERRGLTKDEYFVYISRYVGSRKFKDIGKELQVTQVRARQIYLKAQKKLQHPETQVWIKQYRGLL